MVIDFCSWGIPKIFKSKSPHTGTTLWNSGADAGIQALDNVLCLHDTNNTITWILHVFVKDIYFLV